MDNAQLSSGLLFKGTINQTCYVRCKRLANALLLPKETVAALVTSGGEDGALDIFDRDLALSVLLMLSPRSGEMARAFSRTIMHTVLHEKHFNTTLENEMRHLYELSKVWKWGHTYMETGNAEIPGWFFRHVELFLYHTMLQVVTQIGSLTRARLKKHSMTNARLCAAIQVVCTMAKGAAEALPDGPVKREASGALLLLKACESVEHSILNEQKVAMHRGHVVLAMVMARDALHNPARDALESGNMFAHLFASGTALNFLRRAGEFALNWKDNQPATEINKVELEMLNTVRELDEEVCLRRRETKRKTVAVTTRRRLPPPCTESPHDDNKFTPRELCWSENEEDTCDNGRKRAGGDFSCATPQKYTRNEWMSKYPGVTKNRYWEECEAPGVELETVLRRAVHASFNA